MYKIVDDRGVWVVAPDLSGKLTESEAMQQCNMRNHTDGIAFADGLLNTNLSEAQYKTWRRNHLNRADCTCREKAVAAKKKEVRPK